MMLVHIINTKRLRYLKKIYNIGRLFDAFNQETAVLSFLQL